MVFRMIHGFWRFPTWSLDFLLCMLELVLWEFQPLIKINRRNSLAWLQICQEETYLTKKLAMSDGMVSRWYFFLFLGCHSICILLQGKNPPICVSSWQSIFCFLTFPLHKYPFIIHPPSWIDGFLSGGKNRKFHALCPTPPPPKPTKKPAPLTFETTGFFPIPQPPKKSLFPNKMTKLA